MYEKHAQVTLSEKVASTVRFIQLWIVLEEPVSLRAPPTVLTFLLVFVSPFFLTTGILVNLLNRT